MAQGGGVSASAAAQLDPGGAATGAIKVNGVSYAVVVAGQQCMTLKGPKAGRALLVKNLPTGRWLFQQGRRTTAITSLEADRALYPQLFASSHT